MADSRSPVPIENRFDPNWFSHKIRFSSEKKGEGVIYHAQVVSPVDPRISLRIRLIHLPAVGWEERVRKIEVDVGPTQEDDPLPRHEREIAPVPERLPRFGFSHNLGRSSTTTFTVGLDSAGAATSHDAISQGFRNALRKLVPRFRLSEGKKAPKKVRGRWDELMVALDKSYGEPRASAPRRRPASARGKGLAER